MRLASGEASETGRTMAEAIGSAVEALASQPGPHVGLIAVPCAFSSTACDECKVCAECCEWGWTFMRREDKLLSATTGRNTFFRSFRQRVRRTPVGQALAGAQTEVKGASGGGFDRDTHADGETMLPPPPRPTLVNNELGKEAVKKQAWEHRVDKEPLAKREECLDKTGAA